MNKEIAKGKWSQLKGSAQKEWGKLTNDELDQINGNMEKLSGIIQERYGKQKEEAEKAIQKWCDKNAA